MAKREAVKRRLVLAASRHCQSQAGPDSCAALALECERLRTFAQNILSGNYAMTPADVDRELRAIAKAALGPH